MTRKAAPLTPWTTKRLLAYSTVAGAAAFLGPIEGANAEVIYTPTHAKINHHFALDLNNDGVIDFKLSSYYANTEGKVEVYPAAQGNRIVATPQRCQGLPVAAAPLHSGQIIGPGRNFLNSANCMVVDDTGLGSGPWYHVKNRYLGFVFVINGKEHFGWARLSIDYLPALNNEVLGYAYETIPGKPIVAGDEGNSTEASTRQGSLGALAAGAPALDPWPGQQGIYDCIKQVRRIFMTPIATEPRPIGKGLAKQLLAYATIAGAGIAASASPAEAEVIYTPVHSRVEQDFPIDLNYDGIDDFHVTSYDFSGAGELAVYPLVQGNRIISTPEVCHDDPGGAAALHEGGIIGPARDFSAQANCMAYGFRSSINVSNGAWVHAKNLYLGFEFAIDGKEHFGWARLSFGQFYFQELGMITGYAYETIPGKPIIAGDEGNGTNAAPESGSLGSLALGAPARIK